MLRKFINIVLVLMFITLVIACHKFQDDDALSLKRPVKRLIGKWELSEYYIDGVDSKANYLANAPASCKFEFKGGKLYGYPEFDYFFNSYDCNNIIYQDQFFFKIRKSTMHIQWFFPASYFTILKLYKDDWWIQSIYARKSYLIKFKKIG